MRLDQAKPVRDPLANAFFDRPGRQRLASYVGLAALPWALWLGFWAGGVAKWVAFEWASWAAYACWILFGVWLFMTARRVPRGEQHGPSGAALAVWLIGGPIVGFALRRLVGASGGPADVVGVGFVVGILVLVGTLIRWRRRLFDLSAPAVRDRRAE